MSHSRVLLSALCLVVTITAAGQQLQWFSSYGCPIENSETGDLMIVPNSNGGLWGVAMVGGSTWNMDGHLASVTGDSDMLVFEMSAEGIVQWVKAAGGACEDPDPWDDRPRHALREPASGDLIVTGDYAGNASFGAFTLPGWCEYRNLFVAAYDEDGTVLWASRATGPDILVDAHVVGPDNNIHVFGIVAQAPATFHGSPSIELSTGGFHATYGTDGTLINADHILNTGEVYGAIRTGSDLVVCGRILNADTLWNTPLASEAPLGSGFLCRTNALGSIAWSVVCGSSIQASFVDCVELDNGDIAVAGYYVGDVFIGSDTLYTSTTPPGDRFVARFSPQGDLRWLKPVISPAAFAIRALVAGNDGGLYLHGTLNASLSIGGTSLPCTTSRDQFVAQIDSSGNWTGALLLGRRSPTSVVGLCFIDDALFVSGGFDSTMVIGNQTFEPTNALWPDLFVAKFDGLSTLVVQTQLSSNEVLHIYANPTNGICTVDVPASLATGSALQMRIFDNTGSLVQHVPFLLTDQGTIRLDIRSQPRGVYHVELLSGSQRYAGKIVFE